MDENRVTGTAKNLGGKVEEGLGRMTGDAQLSSKDKQSKSRARLRTFMGKPRMQRRALPTLYKGPLSSSPIRQSRLRLRSAGYSVGRIGPFNDGDSPSHLMERRYLQGIIARVTRTQENRMRTIILS